MKILNLKIYNENEDLIRDIDFTKNDISFVYGNVLKPKNLQETSNSIGKTLTLKMCDYIFGCKVDKSMVDKKLGDYRLSAQIEHNNEKHKVIRSIDGKVFLLDDEEIDLTRYKSIFGIDRNEISRQILLSSKGSLIGYNKNPVQDDYITYISMLGLKNLSKDVEEYGEIRTI